MSPVVVASVNETKLREQIVRYGASLFSQGLTPGSSGNISIRLGGWLVKPTNASLGFPDPTSISRLDLRGNLVCGDKPTKEIL
jgi:ribulose-5-phosphate 4-epimerase/fuculose-1-phosphate aldolase